MLFRIMSYHNFRSAKLDQISEFYRNTRLQKYRKGRLYTTPILQNHIIILFQRNSFNSRFNFIKLVNLQNDKKNNTST